MCDNGYLGYIFVAFLVDPIYKQQSDWKEIKENTGVGKDFLRKTQKAQIIQRKKINKMNFNKYYSSKDAIEKINSRLGEICATTISEKIQTDK